MTFEELASEHRDYILKTCRNVLKNEDDAQDATQDVLLKAWRNFDSFDDSKGHVRSWLRRLAVNQCRDKFRKAKHRRTAEYEDGMVSSEAASTGLTPEQRAKMLDTIEALPEKFREVLLLRLAGYEYEDIAEALDVPRGTVMSRLFHARKAAQARQ